MEVDPRMWGHAGRISCSSRIAGPDGRRVLMLDNGGNLAAPASTTATASRTGRNAGQVARRPAAEHGRGGLWPRRPGATSRRRPPERREAEGWLAEALSAGPISAQQIEAASRAAGLSRITVRRAKERLGVESVKNGYGIEARWLWRLPRADAV